jgi:hypothetical protein
MSTNINITVGDNALLDRAQQQQAANRQAQLQKEATLRLEAEATAARTAALANQGRDANGNPIAGVPFSQPGIDRRPAAYRFAPIETWFVPLLERPTAVQLASPPVFGGIGPDGNPILIASTQRNEAYESPLKVLRPTSEQSKSYVARYLYTVTTETATSGVNNLLLYSGTGGQFNQPYVGTPATSGTIGLDGAFSCTLAKQVPGLYPASSAAALAVVAESMCVEFDVYCGPTNYRSCSANMYLGLAAGSRLGNRYTLSWSTTGSASDSLQLTLTKIDSLGVESTLVSFSTTGSLNAFAPVSSGWTRYAVTLGKTSVSVYRNGTRIALQSFVNPIIKDIYNPSVEFNLVASLDAILEEVRYGLMRLDTKELYTANTYTPQALQ